MKFQLIDNWRFLATRLWSIRLGMLAALLSGIEVVLPLFESAMPRGMFAISSFFVTVGAVVSRLVAQPSIHKDSDGK